MKWTTRYPWIVRSLILLVSLSAYLFAPWPSRVSAQQEAVSTAPEPAPRQAPAMNWVNVASPGVSALARPDSFLPYGSGPGGGQGGGCCHDCHPQGCFLKKLWVWATYCPKERVGCITPLACGSCHYKGSVPYYLFYLNPHCVEGTGLHSTYMHQCYRGCQGCAAAGTCGQP
jgi:hypothetical protein